MLTAGVCVAQTPVRPRFPARLGRRMTAPSFATEGGDYVNEDTVRTARETASHSTGTPEWTNAPGFEKDVFTYARVIYKMNDMPAPADVGLGQ